MRSIKKAGFLFSTLLIALSLIVAGCGNNSGQPANAGASESNDAGKANEEKSGRKLIALAHKSLNYYAFVAMQEAAKRKAQEYGYEFEASVADFDSAKQTNQFINFITKKPAAIITDPNDSEGLITAINQAKTAGIPVGVFDTPTTGGDVAFTVAFDNFKAGQMAAEEIVKRLKEKYGEPKGTVLNAYGAMSSSAWRARKTGFDEVMKKYPNIQYLAMPAEGDMRKTQDVALNAMAKYGNLDAVHAPSDNPAMGLYEALKQKNKLKKVGEDGHVIFVTIDAEPIALQRIKEGWYDATINQDCVAYGEIVIDMLHNYSLQGKEVPLETYKNEKYFWKEAKIVKGDSGPHMIIDPYVIDSSNVDNDSHWGNVAWNEYNLRY
ncbi:MULTISPECIES: sugar ABC transporter substrate-binding protein [Aneurinibacillus]|jgi:ABC-type sugar transport system substrate-binding protein|uniref:Sugar ABC transporter substrate-binding protein n=1 Tax=Aneurinibacillus danicus TaxID=267746 RepID=A0A511VA64_9BACL|nr:MULTISPECIES: sugar ABC transporter substrate-binding protein [Aneurinibacillus]GEN34778.1 sugar ABC transporter substrate-binding protein [Aneurinibacillus danicus]